jgi:predicted RNA binding protein YcfA (HicA-like mRNA interferase family)
MPPVPLLRPRDVIRAFETFGWRVVRQKGSHILLTKPGHLATLSVPDHPPGSARNVAWFDREVGH